MVKAPLAHAVFIAEFLKEACLRHSSIEPSETLNIDNWESRYSLYHVSISSAEFY